MKGYSDFGLRARMIMLKENIKVKTIAEHLGVSSTYVCDIFKGTRESNKYRVKIAQFLGIKEELARKKEAIK